MTTEIAVINRLGVALATDSAVTISGANKSKVFDTGDKLFELCQKKSIGIMINGNMDLLRVPWEIIIKDFRETTREDIPRTMKDWMQCLFDFIKTHKTQSESAERGFIAGLAYEEFEIVKSTVQRRIFSSDVSSNDVGVIINQVTKERTARALSFSPPKSLEQLDRNAVRKRYAGMLNGMIEAQFAPVKIAPSVRMNLRKLAVARMFSGRKTDYSTGLIVAGFADGDMFPSIAIAEVDGCVSGQLKYTHGEHILVDRDRNPGRVISFAQTDVAERILSGVDPRFIKKSEDWLKQSLDGIKSSIVEPVHSGGVPEKVAREIFDEITAAMAGEYRGKFSKAAKEEFEKDFNEMVAMMPKPNIIELAEALVSITAIERKASSDLATVGGPVDVAFITRHEGFVWIKRKHYFEPHLNPRFFARKYGSMGTIGGHREQPSG